MRSFVEAEQIFLHLFSSGLLQQEEDEWETVPTKSKGRKHGAEPDANMSAPPAKESRGADGLSSEGSGPLPPATEGGRAALQRGPGRPRGPPRERDGRRGRGRARGSAAARQQRMVCIEEGPEGRSPPRARPAEAVSGQQDGEFGQAPCGPLRPRRERRPRPARLPAMDQLQQEGRNCADAFSHEPCASEGPLDGSSRQRQLGSRGRGRGGGGPGRGRGAGRGPRPDSDRVAISGGDAMDREGLRAPRSFRGRGRGGQGRKIDGPHAGRKMHAAIVSAVPYVSVQGE